MQKETEIYFVTTIKVLKQKKHQKKPIWTNAPSRENK